MKKVISVFSLILVLICAFSFLVSAESVYTWDYSLNSSWCEPIPDTPEYYSMYNFFNDTETTSGDYRYCAWPKDWFTTPSSLTGLRVVYNLGLFDDYTPFVFHRDRVYYFEFRYFPQVKYGVGDSWLYGVDLNDSKYFRDGYLSFTLTFASNWESETDYKFYYVEIPFEDVISSISPPSNSPNTGLVADWKAYFSFAVDGVDVDGYALNQVDVLWKLNGRTAQGMRIDGYNWTVTSTTETEILANAIRGDIKASTDQINKKIDASTNKITGEIEASTNKITNGWVSNPKAPAGSEVVGDAENLENQIMSDAQSGVDQGNSLLTGFSGALTAFRGGFLFITGIYNLLFDVSWVNTLIQIGLALGAIAFVLGLSSTLASRLSRSEKGSKGSKKGG